MIVIYNKIIKYILLCIDIKHFWLLDYSFDFIQGGLSWEGFSKPEGIFTIKKPDKYNLLTEPEGDEPS